MYHTEMVWLNYGYWWVVLSNFRFFVFGCSADELSIRCCAGALFATKLLLEDEDLLDEGFFDLTKIFGKYTVHKQAKSIFCWTSLISRKLGWSCINGQHSWICGAFCTLWMIFLPPDQKYNTAAEYHPNPIPTYANRTSIQYGSQSIH